MQVSTFTPAQVLQIMGPTGSITGPAVLRLRRHRPDDPRGDRGRPRHARLDADRAELRRHVQDRQDITVAAQRRVPDGFGPHRGPDRAGRDARSPCSRAWAAPARTSSTPSSTTRRRPRSPRAPPRSPGPSGPPTASTSRPRSPACKASRPTASGRSSSPTPRREPPARSTTGR